MGYLTLAILCSASLGILFRLFKDYRVKIRPAVAINYLVCVIVGYLFGAERLAPHELTSTSWFFYACFQGLLLSGNFYILAIAAQRIGVTLASLCNRLAVALPVFLAFFLYNDTLTPLKLLGLIGSLLTLYLSTYSPKDTTTSHRGLSKLFLLILFTSFGAHYSLLKYVQEFYLTAASQHSYVTASFAAAFIVSLIIETLRLSREAERITSRDLIGGLILGTANYATVYLAVKVLSLEGWQSSVVFPTISVGVVLISTITGLLYFKERLTARQQIGLVIGVVSVGLLNQ